MTDLYEGPFFSSGKEGPLSVLYRFSAQNRKECQG